MAAITFPLLTVVDDAGAIVSGATVTIASVADKAGTPIAAHGAAVSLAGANVSVDYDPIDPAKGQAWVTLAISKAGSTFTGLNAAPSFFLTADAQRLAQILFTGDGRVKVALSDATGAEILPDTGLVAAVTAGVWSATERALTATGLDAITATEPTAAIDGAMSTWNFRKLLRWGVMRMARGTKNGSATIVVRTLNGTTSTTQAISVVAGVETLEGPT